MLCPGCRRQIDPRAPACNVCGRLRTGDVPPLEIVLADHRRVLVIPDMTIGRAAGSTLKLKDQSVSRLHARIRVDGDEARLEDAGSSYGTFLDGERIAGPMSLRDGARIRVGDSEFTVERRREMGEASRTIVVPPGASVLVPRADGEGHASATTAALRPRVRSGYALKRLEATERPYRYCLLDLRDGHVRRMSDDDAELFALLDGSHTVQDLINRAERRFGAAGGPRLAQLLADLIDRGLLAGLPGGAADDQPARRGIRRLLRTRERPVSWAGPLFDAIYARGGWVVFSGPGRAALGALSVAGLIVFGVLIVKRYGTPFIVADKAGLGALTFLLGRFAVAAVHEAAHGLAMASYGRRVERAGVKLIAIFPYLFVDTSAAWFEPRARRITVSAAGPLADLSLGGVFSGVCLLLPESPQRDVFFQLACAAYVGALFNLNPFLERDGYHILLDVLRQPRLRLRARAYLAGRIAGHEAAISSSVLFRYAVGGLIWSAAAAFFAAAMSLHFTATAEQIGLPLWILWTLFGTLCVVLFAPVIAAVGPPLWQRVRSR